MNDTTLNTTLSTALNSPLQTQPKPLSSGVLPGLQSSQVQSISSSALRSDLVTVNDPITYIDFRRNTLSGAQNLGTLSGPMSLTGWVGSTDTIDFYKVNVNSSRLNISLTGLAGDADLRLIQDVNQNGLVDYSEILATSNRFSMRDETINVSGLTAGSYFIEVLQFSGDTSYKLRLSDAYVNDLIAIETDLGNLSGTQIFSGHIDNKNTADIYKFTASTIYNVNISVTGLSADADVRLIRDTNNNGLLDSTDVVVSSLKSGSAAEKINASIPGLTYFVQVNQFGNSDTNYHLGVSSGDWFNTNLVDDEIMGEARYAYYNGGGIDRNEMIGLLRNAKDYGAIDSSELTDLRQIVANAAGLGIADYVRVLARKVVNTDPANARSGIGNLFSGSSSTQMENLIGKWFLGTDRPAAAGTYQYANGALFQNGISYRDVDQGQVGDCYFLASLGAVALKAPTNISNMFTDNGDGSFTVRFFNNGVADYVTVDRYLPTYAGGGFIYANDSSGLAYNDANNELWVALAEKAYVQMSQSGWTEQDVGNTYESIAGGWAKITLEQITGRSATANWMNLANIWTAFTSGQSIALHTNNVTETGIVGNHVYVFTGFNYTTGRYTVYNPWGGGDGLVELTGAQLLNNFSQWDAVA